MPGTRAGGLKAVATNKKKYGDDFYARIGHIGGSTSPSSPRGFAASHELAVRAGRKGGTISRRGKAKPKKVGENG